MDAILLQQVSQRQHVSLWFHDYVDRSVVVAVGGGGEYWVIRGEWANVGSVMLT
jgi:hypothetical protein